MARWNPSFSGLAAKMPALAVVAALALVVAALTRRRFRVAWFLFHVAVALGENWSEKRARRRVAGVLTARTDAGEATTDTVLPESA